MNMDGRSCFPPPENDFAKGDHEVLCPKKTKSHIYFYIFFIDLRLPMPICFCFCSSKIKPF